MRRIMIENVRVGISKGGMACGPVPGCVVAEVQIREEQAPPTFYGMVEVDGIAEFYACPNSRYEIQIADDFEDEFPAAEGYCSYSEFYEDLKHIALRDEAHALLLKFIVYLVRADWDEIDRMKTVSIGKAIGEFDIPICDAEQDYIEETEDD